MTDFVVPSGVRIADADRVRLGAHLAEGTTVMHEGFVNYNAGTLGPSMVEGRISQGVVVGAGSDVGGGASIMGTLSGGGTHRISIGKGSLLGANSGIGISLGDDCVVEAGLYVTAGTKVTDPHRRPAPAYRQRARALRRRQPAVPPQLDHRRRRGDRAQRCGRHAQHRAALQRATRARCAGGGGAAARGRSSAGVVLALRSLETDLRSWRGARRPTATPAPRWPPTRPAMPR